MVEHYPVVSCIYTPLMAELHFPYHPQKTIWMNQQYTPPPGSHNCQ